MKVVGEPFSLESVEFVNVVVMLRNVGFVNVVDVVDVVLGVVVLFIGMLPTKRKKFITSIRSKTTFILFL